MRERSAHTRRSCRIDHAFTSRTTTREGGRRGERYNSSGKSIRRKIHGHDRCDIGGREEKDKSRLLNVRDTLAGTDWTQERRRAGRGGQERKRTYTGSFMNMADYTLISRIDHRKLLSTFSIHPLPTNKQV